MIGRDRRNLGAALAGPQAGAAHPRAATVDGGTSILARLRVPSDIKTLTGEELRRLADEVRAFLVEAVPSIGGHLGAGLGVVELTVALYAEFDFNQRDKLVWDVGHQCYPHKVLTGRMPGFATLRRHGGMSGFPDPKESSYDTVKTGHGGTSISTAMGFALAWHGDPAQRGRHAVAVIGDGSLQEGNAYEALHHAGSLDELPLIVVLNDNEMSISPSCGAMRDALLRMRRTGPAATGTRAADELPAGNFFEELGFQYAGPIDGHDLPAVRAALRAARRSSGPVLLHVITRKGRGYRDDVPERTCYHAVSPPTDRKPAVPAEYPGQGGPTFAAAFTEQCGRLLESDPRVIVLSAAMLEGTGLVRLHEAHPTRCLDVGMAEQHAVGLAAGLALAGQRPICAIYSTFLQRAYDQLFQEVALQNAPVLFCLDRGGLVGSDGATHNGLFDIGYLRGLPNFAVMAPRDTGELAQMMTLAWAWGGPVAIRFPRGAGAHPDVQRPHRPFAIGEAETLAAGDDGCLLAYGVMTYAALAVRDAVRERTGRTLAVINARFAKPLDVATIRTALERHPVVFTIEDHMVATGFGSAVSELVRGELRGHVDANRLHLLGIPDRFVDHGERAEQLAAVGLDVPTLTERVSAVLRSSAT